VAGQAEPIEAEVGNDHASLVGVQRGSTLYFQPKGQALRAG
ncbi:MAG TPA: sulfate ABC transporter ATP-binding protein, partial [Pseudomonas sp.]|nr:sulfate ABC transporter ATP-binding protein [Pseudomonas sp.]